MGVVKMLDGPLAKAMWCVVCSLSHLWHLCAGSFPILLFWVSSASGIPVREAKRDREVDSKVLFGGHDSVKRATPSDTGDKQTAPIMTRNDQLWRHLSASQTGPEANNAVLYQTGTRHPLSLWGLPR